MALLGGGNDGSFTPDAGEQFVCWFVTEILVDEFALERPLEDGLA